MLPVVIKQSKLLKTVGADADTVLACGAAELNELLEACLLLFGERRLVSFEKGIEARRRDQGALEGGQGPLYVLIGQ